MLNFLLQRSEGAGHGRVGPARRAADKSLVRFDHQGHQLSNDGCLRPIHAGLGFRMGRGHRGGNDQQRVDRLDKELICTVDDIVQRSRLREHVPCFSQELVTRWQVSQMQIDLTLYQAKRIPH